MFDEEDLGAEALLVQGDDGSSVPLDRLQVKKLTSFTNIKTIIMAQSAQA